MTPVTLPVSMLPLAPAAAKAARPALVLLIGAALIYAARKSQERERLAGTSTPQRLNTR